MALIERLCTGLVVVLFAWMVVLCGCQGLVNTPASTSTGGSNNGIKSINHIIFMAQENRSFDNYFGQLPAYWAANGYPAQQFDGLPAGAGNSGCSGATIP